MNLDLRRYEEAGEDMADFVKAGNIQDIKSVFRWMVESMARETTGIDKDRAREMFFEAFEEQMSTPGASHKYSP